MTTKEEHQENINKYNAIKEQLDKITPKLSSASSFIGSVDHEVKTTYKVDNDDPRIAKHTSNLKSCIENVYENLTSVVIPALGTAKDNARTEIYNIEVAEEEAERQAAEAAAAAAEQATSTPTNIDPGQSSTSTDEERRRGRRG